MGHYSPWDEPKLVEEDDQIKLVWGPDEDAGDSSVYVFRKSQMVEVHLDDSRKLSRKDLERILEVLTAEEEGSCGYCGDATKNPPLKVLVCDECDRRGVQATTKDRWS